MSRSHFAHALHGEALLKLVHIITLCVLIAAGPAAAALHDHHHHPKHTNIFMSFLKGSPAKLARQNKIADRERLARLNEKTLRIEKNDRELVALPRSRALKIDGRLLPEYRYCRPETATFLNNFSGLYYTHFHHSLTVTSAVRSVERQQALRRVNGNAARGNSHLRLSSHLTGATFDITKVGMTPGELSWARAFLTDQQRKGRVEATEEFQQKVFHVMVIKLPADTHRKHRTHHGSPHKVARVFCYHP